MGWAQKIMVVLHFIEITFLLNILWIIGFLMGLGIFGAFPSTRSVFVLINQGVLRGDSELTLREIFGEYFTVYRANFFTTNKFAIIYALIYLIMLFDFNVISVMPVKIKVFTLTLFVILLFYVFLTNTYLLMNDDISFSKTTFKKIMVMPIAFPIASVIFFIFTFVITLLAIRFSFIFAVCYFSGIILFQEYFLNANIRRRLGEKS